VSELAEITRELFVRVTTEYPALRERVHRLAEERTGVFCISPNKVHSRD